MINKISNTELGARNLLVNCGKMESGQSLLILYESCEHGYFDKDITNIVASTAKSLGLDVTMEEVPFKPEVTELSQELRIKMGAVNATLFIARLGDQMRFQPSLADFNPIVSYVLDIDMLGSSFGCVDYRAFEDLKFQLNTLIWNAKEIHATCPLGTDFKGSLLGESFQDEDVAVRRFPMSVFKPAPAIGFSGCIAQSGFLVGTGSSYYSPFACELIDTVFIEFEGNKIKDITGDENAAKSAKSHYKHVSKLYGIDGDFVHSWHAGIHPGISFNQPASANFERWSGGAFGSPRILHFHTCGAYAPGEISLNVLDPTIRIDGVAVWENGHLYPDRIPLGKEILEKYPCAHNAFANPSNEVGTARNGQLSFRG